MKLEKIIVYETLKNTALHCEDGMRNARIYMYVVYFTLLAFGRNYIDMLLVSFIVLIAFQSMINNDKYSIERIAAYILVFFETKREGMHWSKLNRDFNHLEIYKTQYQNVGWYINFYASSILALISLILIFANSLNQCEFELNRISVVGGIEIVIAIFLCFLVISINFKGNISRQTRKIIEQSIITFYKKCEEEQKS